MRVVALRKESVDRNITSRQFPAPEPPRSLSARRAWIEILVAPGYKSFRNSSLSARRAWIEISTYVIRLPRCQVSLSARRAWIEIKICGKGFRFFWVALRKESVDRNVNLRVLDGSKSSSLSARRAWIEIDNYNLHCVEEVVALRKESVDRNIIKL